VNCKIAEISKRGTLKVARTVRKEKQKRMKEQFSPLSTEMYLKNRYS